MTKDKPISQIVLETLNKTGASNPGDIVSKTNLPRYLVLAAFQILEELEYVKCIYHKGSHKVYTITEKGKEYIEENQINNEQAEEAIA